MEAWRGWSRAALLFTETFQYPISSNLAGQNGGTGFSGAWSGGNSTLVAGLVSGSGSAVQIGSMKMWGTSNLAIDPNTLVAGTPSAQLLGTRDNFSFSTIKVAGDYAGALKVAGIASSPNVSEAASVSVNAVPEPATLSLIGAGALLAGLRAVRRIGRH